MKKLRVFLADDHEIVREGLKLLIDAQGDMEVVGEAGDGKEAYRKAARLQPDVVIMDVSMPDWNGVQATQQLRKDYPEIKVMALTVHEDEIYLRKLLAAGASGYVVKRSAADELARAIRTVAEGGLHVAAQAAERVLKGLARTATGPSEEQDSELSDREEEVLRLLAWGYSNKEIGSSLNISVKTVETYKSRLMEKLNLRSRTEIVRYALRMGWLKET